MQRIIGASLPNHPMAARPFYSFFFCLEVYLHVRFQSPILHFALAFNSYFSFHKKALANAKSDSCVNNLSKIPRLVFTKLFGILSFIYTMAKIAPSWGISLKQNNFFCSLKPTSLYQFSPQFKRIFISRYWISMTDRFCNFSLFPYVAIKGGSNSTHFHILENNFFCRWNQCL